ncbi:hypothetical protein HYT58_01240, partial [Candidatus Woesearchaeota archaeon]|nr:hypothetical protein [Candidatus Woesearchaeota archaeon]
MLSVANQECVNAVLITPDNISFDSRDIKIENKDGLLEINIPNNYKGELKYKVNGSGTLNEKAFFNIGENCDLIIYEERKGEIRGYGEIKINLGNNSKLVLIEIQNSGYKTDYYINKKIECCSNS